MSAQLRAEQNSADNATGFDYFPNLLFPVGLALGYSWDPPARARFWEVNGPAERRAWEYSYPLLDILGLPEERIQLLEVDCDPEEVRCIALSIMLTMGVSNYKQGEPFGRIDGFAGFGRSFVVGVGAPNKGGVLPVRVQPNGPTRSGTQNPVLTPAEAIVSTGRAIRQVFASFPNTPIVLTGRVTKTVSMALGWYLANAEVEIGPGVSIVSPKHPWRWLIPLGDFGPEHTLRPMWVRHDQPDPAELLKEAEIRWAT
jgi:hypothetical protein